MLMWKQHCSCTDIPDIRNMEMPGDEFQCLFCELHEDPNLFHVSNELDDSINKCIYWPNNISIPISSRLHTEGRKTRRSFHISCEKKSSLPKANSKCGIMCACFLYQLMLCCFCSSCKWQCCSKPSCSQQQGLHTGWAKILLHLAISSQAAPHPRAGLWLAWNTAQCQQEYSSPVFKFFLHQVLGDLSFPGLPKCFINIYKQAEWKINTEIL